MGNKNELLFIDKLKIENIFVDEYNLYGIAHYKIKILDFYFLVIYKTPDEAKQIILVMDIEGNTQDVTSYIPKYHNIDSTFYRRVVASSNPSVSNYFDIPIIEIYMRKSKIDSLL